MTNNTHSSDSDPNPSESATFKSPTPHSSELDNLARDLISYAHAPIGHAKIGKKGDTYIMDAAQTDTLAEWIVRYGIDRFKVILAREKQAAYNQALTDSEGALPDRQIPVTPRLPGSPGAGQKVHRTNGWNACRDQAAQNIKALRKG